MTLPLKHSFSMIIAGPSMAGKSQWVANLLRYRDTMISPSPVKTYVCYSEWQPLYNELRDIEFHQGLIDVETLDSSIPKLIIFDDLMDSCDQKVSQIFTKHAHHRNISCVWICQNLFHKDKHMRTMNLNSSYLVLFKNPRDINQISFLSRQMYPTGQTKFLSEAFRDATSVPFGYLFIDLKQETEDLLRIRTGVFPHEKTYIYMPKCASSSLPKYSLNCKDHD